MIECLALMVGIVIRVIVISELGPPEDIIGTLLLTLGIFPYVILFGISSETKIKLLKIAIASLVVVADVSAVYEAMYGGTSTSVIAIIFEPIAVSLAMAAVWIVVKIL